MTPSYPDELDMQTARARYFEANGFGKNGGYDEPWVKFALGPLPVHLPNTKQRVRAVRYHDLHHIVTGYETTTLGEFEIAAWELGAGCGAFVAAWVLNLAGVGGGLFRAPRRTFRAFVRGRASRSLYGKPYEPLLAETVGSVRARTGTDRAALRRATLTDLALFSAYVLLGVAVGLVLAALGVLLAIPVLAWSALRGPASEVPKKA